MRLLQTVLLGSQISIALALPQYSTNPALVEERELSGSLSSALDTALAALAGLQQGGGAAAGGAKVEGEAGKAKTGEVRKYLV